MSANNENDPLDLYEMVCDRLDELQATHLTTAIRAVVTRGTVTPPDKETVEKKSQLVRRMQSAEALAVAIELLLSAAQIPLMIGHAKESFQCDSIVWMRDGAPLFGDVNESLNAKERSLFEDSQQRGEVQAILPEVDMEMAISNEDPDANAILGEIDLTELRELLNKLIKLKKELNIRLPEVV